MTRKNKTRLFISQNCTSGFFSSRPIKRHRSFNTVGLRLTEDHIAPHVSWWCFSALGTCRFFDESLKLPRLPSTFRTAKRGAPNDRTSLSAPSSGQRASCPKAWIGGDGRGGHVEFREFDATVVLFAYLEWRGRRQWCGAGVEPIGEPDAASGFEGAHPCALQTGRLSDYLSRHDDAEPECQ